MQKEKSLLILGAGGFGRVIKDLAHLLGYETVSFLDDKVQGIEILGKLESFAQHAAFAQAYPAFGDNRLRLFWMEKLEKAGYRIPCLIHPQAAVSESASLGEGCVVLAKAVVQTGVTAGRGVLFNCGSITDHDAVVGDGAHLCLGCIVKAGYTVPDCVKIEAGVVADKEHPV